jgi:hypothetical protein
MFIKIKNMVVAIGCILLLLQKTDGYAQVAGIQKESSMIDKKNLRELVVRPTLIEIKLHSDAAEELLMLTFAQETKLGTYLRQGWKKINDGLGVGLGIGSMEPRTFLWLKKLYHNILGGRYPEELVWDLQLVVITTRLRYLVVPEALPAANDIKGLAKYWDKYYNGNPYAGTWQEAVINYNELVK